MTTTTHEARPPKVFSERLQALLGATTYRVPVEGRSTRERAMPVEHEVAAALGYARRQVCATCRAPVDELSVSPRRSRMACGHPHVTVPDVNDIGPDIASDVLFRQTRNARKVCGIVADTMAEDRARSVARCKPWLRLICWAAYVELVQGIAQGQLKPDEVSIDDWALLVSAAVRIYEITAEDAVGRARQAWRRAA